MSQHSTGKSSSNQVTPKQDNGFSQERADNAESSSSAEQILREMQDEIAPEATPLWQFVNDKAPMLAVIVVSLVLIISGFAFYQGYQESVFDDAKIELSVIISNVNDAERLATLEAYKKEAPTKLLVAIELEIAQAAMILGDYTKAQSAFSYVQKKEGKNPLGISATINIADLLARQGEAQKAIDMYESVIEKVPAELSAGFYVNIGDIAASANLKEKAISAYKQALDALAKHNAEFESVEYINFRIMQLS